MDNSIQHHSWGSMGTPGEARIEALLIFNVFSIMVQWMGCIWNQTITSITFLSRILDLFSIIRDAPPLRCDWFGGATFKKKLGDIRALILTGSFRLINLLQTAVKGLDCEFDDEYMPLPQYATMRALYPLFVALIKSLNKNDVHRFVNKYLPKEKVVPKRVPLFKRPTISECLFNWNQKHRTYERKCVKVGCSYKKGKAQKVQKVPALHMISSEESSTSP